jgi:hypothetical protein
MRNGRGRRDGRPTSRMERRGGRIRTRRRRKTRDKNGRTEERIEEETEGGGREDGGGRRERRGGGGGREGKGRAGEDEGKKEARGEREKREREREAERVTTARAGSSVSHSTRSSATFLFLFSPFGSFGSFVLRPCIFFPFAFFFTRPSTSGNKLQPGVIRGFARVAGAGQSAAPASRLAQSGRWVCRFGLAREQHREYSGWHRDVVFCSVGHRDSSQGNAVRFWVSWLAGWPCLGPVS